MKAFVRTNAHTQEVQISEVEVPEIGTDEVLIKVEAFGVGIHDRYFIPQTIDFPYVIGSEGAGTIEKVGDEVAGFDVDDRVIFTTALQPQGGSWAEYAAASQRTLVSLPDNLTFTQGAAIPIAGKTAMECMRSLGLNQGDSLFIAGGSGAIGTLVIQLAASKGIHVSASASSKNHEYMKSLGVEKAVDYRDEDWPEQIRDWADGGVTAALAIQPGTGIDSIKAVKDDGRLITVSGDNAQVVPERNIIIQQMSHTQQGITPLVDAISNGEINLVIEKEYAFEEALDALRKTETRHAQGKLVVNGIK